MAESAQPKFGRGFRENRGFGILQKPAALLGAIALVTVPILVAVPWAPSPKAEAADEITIGAVTARLYDHAGTGGTSGNCIKYAPPGTGATTTWVTSPNTAATAHGYPSFGPCPTNLNSKTQSTFQFSPAASTNAAPSTPVALGMFAHVNNEVSARDRDFSGKMGIRLPGLTPVGGSGPAEFTFPWTMVETPNTGPAPDDIFTFTQQTSTQMVQDAQNNVYRLDILGFENTAGAKTCPATFTEASVQDNFITKEGVTTRACLWGSLTLMREVKVVKQVSTASETPPSWPTFNFNTTSSLAGSAWDGTSFPLEPTALGAAGAKTYGPHPVGTGVSETVSISETLPGDDWFLESAVCVDGAGQPVSGATATATGVNLSNIPSEPNVAKRPITCTLTNRYAPKATLTLKKQLVDGGPATVNSWTLSANRTNGTQPINGIPGVLQGTSGVTGTVQAGSYQLSETPLAGQPTEAYDFTGWTCTGASGAAVPVTGGAVALKHGDNVTCTARNTFNAGSVKITKTITDPDSGFTGTNDTKFSGKIACSKGSWSKEYPFTALSVNTPFTQDNIPAGAVCAVTENQPTGNLRDASYTWNTPAAAPASVTVTKGQTANAVVNNQITRGKGSLQLTKQVAGRTPDIDLNQVSPTLKFPLQYSCKIGTTEVANGTENVAAGETKTVTNIPVTAVCSVTENLVPATGDFLNPAYAWDGKTITDPVTIGGANPARVTVTNYVRSDVGKLEITKKFTSSGLTNPDKVFEVKYSCPGASGAVNLKIGESKTVTVPARTACTVIETAPSGDLNTGYIWNSPNYTGLAADQTVTVPANGVKNVLVTNSTRPVYAKVRVTKKATGAVEGIAQGTTFPITISCDRPSEGETVNYATTQNLPVNGEFTTPRLILGAKCTISEVAPTGSNGLVDGSYSWDGAPANQVVVVSRSDETHDATVTNKVKRVYAQLSITKKVTALGGVDGANSTFGGSWYCKYGTETLTGTWGRTGAGAATVTGPAIPVASRCWATETQQTQPHPTDGSYYWEAVGISHMSFNPLVMTADGGEITVTNKVGRITGLFKVSKDVQGGPAGVVSSTAVFPISYKCTALDGTEFTGTLPVTTPGDFELPDVPAKSTCTVTEGPLNQMPQPQDPYRWDPEMTWSVTGAAGNQTGRAVTFTMPADENAAVALVAHNPLSKRFGKVTVTKELSGSTAGFTGGQQTMFPVNLECSDGATRATNLAAGGQHTFSDVPIGATCSVTEGLVTGGLADASYAWAKPIIGAAVKANETTPATIKVTNPIERRTADLSINKVVTDPYGVVPAGFAYSGTWKCSHTGDADRTGTWSVTGPGTATVTNPTIYPGSTCTLTENALAPVSADTSYRWETPQLPPVVATASGANATVTNKLTRDLGKLVISKELTGATAGYTGSGFKIGYTCSGPAQGGGTMSSNVTVPANGSVTVAGVPVGWSCVISETLDPADLADASYGWTAPVYTNDSASGSGNVVVIRSTAGNTAKVTNKINRIMGTFTVSKALGANAQTRISPDTTFAGTWTCAYGTQQWQGTWSGKPGQAATLTGVPAEGLPLTTSCSVLENAQPAAALPTGWTWNDPQLEPAKVITDSTQPASFTVTNEIKRQWGGLTVAKAFTGAGADKVKTDAKVTGQAVCTSSDFSVALPWTLPATGGEVVLATPADQVVAAGTNCVISENPPAQTLLTDATWAWNNPVIAPASAPITNGAMAKVTVTNSLHRVTGSLQLTKEITGKADAGHAFVVDVVCTHDGDPNMTQRVTLEPDKPFTLQNIIAGSQCKATELPPSAPPEAANPATTWGPVAYSPADTVAVAAGQTAAVKITNPVVARMSSLSVKVLPIQGATDFVKPDWEFQIQWKCTTPAGHPVNGVKALPADGQAVPVAELQVGSTCTVKQLTMPALPGGARWRDPVWTAVESTGAVEAPASRAAVSAPSQVRVAAPASAAPAPNPVDNGIDVTVPVNPLIASVQNGVDAGAIAGKKFVSATPVMVGGKHNGTWWLEYQVSAQNSSTVAALTYSITDTPAFNKGAELLQTLIGKAGEELKPATPDGEGKYVLAPPGTALAGGATDTWTIKMLVKVEPKVTVGECTAESALYNKATAITPAQSTPSLRAPAEASVFFTSDAEACGEVPELPPPPPTKPPAKPLSKTGPTDPWALLVGLFGLVGVGMSLRMRRSRSAS